MFEYRILLCSSGYSGTFYVDQASLELMAILQPQLPECWDFRHVLTTHCYNYTYLARTLDLSLLVSFDSFVFAVSQKQGIVLLQVDWLSMSKSLPPLPKERGGPFTFSCPRVFLASSPVLPVSSQAHFLLRGLPETWDKPLLFM